MITTPIEIQFPWSLLAFESLKSALFYGYNFYSHIKHLHAFEFKMKTNYNQTPVSNSVSSTPFPHSVINKLSLSFLI